MDQVGDDVGTPTISFDGRGVLRSGAHQGPDAARTPAGSGTPASTLSAYPHFHELKRSRDKDLDFG